MTGDEHEDKLDKQAYHKPRNKYSQFSDEQLIGMLTRLCGGVVNPHWRLYSRSVLESQLRLLEERP